MRQSVSTSSEGWDASSGLPEQVASAVDYVATYLGDNDDWVDVKIEIMNSLRPELRRLFSRRDQATRDQVVSEFDRAVMERYNSVSGVSLVVRPLRERQIRRTGLASDSE